MAMVGSLATMVDHFHAHVTRLMVDLFMIAGASVAATTSTVIREPFQTRLFPSRDRTDGKTIERRIDGGRKGGFGFGDFQVQAETMEEKKVTTMELKVDLQCRRCYNKVKKVLSKLPQIRDQRFDKKANTVTITVVSCCLEQLRDKLYYKGGGQFMIAGAVM
ncbi:Uncharacterized protein TCM_030423 [Theobroma cacao]|uniref:HMA domain-containing protein n=1 Tax=Theobroma cacao TaxID=3641 RepID=A0A061GGG7_THECC|nr:Uncharacterized protein TCM_030423 [Theobroma cacao]